MLLKLRFYWSIGCGIENSYPMLFVLVWVFPKNLRNTWAVLIMHMNGVRNTQECISYTQHCQLYTTLINISNTITTVLKLSTKWRRQMECRHPGKRAGIAFSRPELRSLKIVYPFHLSTPIAFTNFIQNHSQLSSSSPLTTKKCKHIVNGFM